MDVGVGELTCMKIILMSEGSGERFSLSDQLNSIWPDAYVCLYSGPARGLIWDLRRLRPSHQSSRLLGFT